MRTLCCSSSARVAACAALARSHMLSNTWINAPAVRQSFLVLAGSSTWLLQQQQQHSKQTVRCRHSAPHQVTLCLYACFRASIGTCNARCALERYALAPSAELPHHGCLQLPIHALQAAAASPGAATAEPQQQQTAEKQLPRFYAPQLPTSIGAAVQLEPEEARHAVKVLRLKQGDAVELCDGKGSLVQCEVAYTDRSSATVSCQAPKQHAVAADRGCASDSCSRGISVTARDCSARQRCTTSSSSRHACAGLLHLHS